MPSVYLHIGLPKTGTTYLQAMLFDNRQRLQELGVHVADAGSIIHEVGDINREPAGHTLSHHKLAWSLQRQRDDVAKLPIEDLRSALASDFGSNETTLISSECFYWEVRDGADIASFRRLLPENVHVLAWLRNRWEFIDSMYCQAVYDHQFKGAVEDFVEENSDFFDYGAALSQWGNVFGAKALKLSFYDSSKDPLQQLLHAIGVPSDGLATRPMNINASVPVAVIPVLRTLELSDREAFWFVADQMKKSAKAFPKVRLLSEAYILELERKFQAGDEYLAALGLDVEAVTGSSRYLQKLHINNSGLSLQMADAISLTIKNINSLSCPVHSATDDRPASSFA